MDATDTKKLAQLIQRQWTALSALRQLILQQSECLGADNVELLLSLLARKQPLLEELLQVQSELSVYRDQDAEQRQWSSAAERLACQALAAKCDEVHQEILRLENGALGELEIRRTAVAAQLQDCRDSTLANSAYSSEAFLESSSLDLTN